MWVEELKSGKFRVAERYADPLSGRLKKVSVVIEKNTKKDLRAAQASLQDKINHLCSYSLQPTDITLEKLASLYMDDQYRVNKVSTARRNGYACNSILDMLGRSTLVKNLSAGYVRTQFLAKYPNPGTYNEFAKRFKQMIRWGYDNDLVGDISYLSKLKTLKDETKKQKIEEKFLEPEQIRKLIDGMAKDNWKDLTQFLVLSGLRIGEALALDIPDIDIKNREIHVTKTYDFNNDLITSTKTAAGTRDVFIQDELLPLAKRLRSDALAEKLLSGQPWIFQADGKRYNYGSYSHYLSENGIRLLDKARVTPHMLRHTHVSLLAAEGLSFDEISRRVGHENSSVTKDIYFHVTEKLKEKERENIKSVKLL